jgi:heme/copper-type cytochrome/quinol oxidase subunit 2
MLNGLLLIIFVFIRFFILTVLYSIIYIILSKSVVHYIGTKKIRAETVAFLFSCFSLLLIGYPSLSLLYQHCTARIVPGIAVNITGSQWYWSYELGNYFDEPVYMYMRRLDTLNVGDARFLSVDNRLVLPVGANIQFFITSSDVIHGFNLPTLGVKYDAIPGVLTVVPIVADQVGVFVGQCREICGAGHSFIPIVIEVTSPQSFINYYNNMGTLVSANGEIIIPSSAINVHTITAHEMRLEPSDISRPFGLEFGRGHAFGQY